MTLTQADSGTPLEHDGDALNPWLWALLKMPCRLTTTLMFDLKTYGKRHVPAAGGALLISNHQSNLDPVLLAVHLRRQVSFMAKIELFQNRHFGWLIRQLNAFPVRRGEGDVGAIREVLRRLKEGKVLTLFPEGTRTRDGRIGRIQPGIAMIVKRAQVPVIPAVIDGSFQSWPRGRKLFRPHPIRVMYGPPLRVEKLKAEQIVQLIASTLNGMLEELRKRG